MATEYRRDIDGLRAIAVVSVVLFHTNLRIFEGGFIGVDIFFVISGYLITKILLNELTKKGNISYLNFYERRIRRILPVLFIVLIVCCAFGWLTLIPYEYDLFLRTLISVIFFLSNTRLGQENNYFDPVNHTKPLTHTWSLGVEER
jgi:peptidoglycan/LPS O-acetylase OafA/YrhL